MGYLLNILQNDSFKLFYSDLIKLGFTFKNNVFYYNSTPLIFINTDNSLKISSDIACDGKYPKLARLVEDNLTELSVTKFTINDEYSILPNKDVLVYTGYYSEVIIDKEGSIILRFTPLGFDVGSVSSALVLFSQNSKKSFIKLYNDVHASIK